MSEIKSIFKNFLRAIAMLCVRIYQVVLSPFLGGACRFEPSCSHYALEALESESFFHATFLILKRLSKCHPWGGSGFDPVHFAPTGLTQKEVFPHE